MFLTKIFLNSKVKFVIVALGIFLLYFAYGILQERITRDPYGKTDEYPGERFEFPWTLVFVMCTFSWLFAKVLSVTNPEKKDETHFGYYTCSAVAYLLAMVTSNMALKWVAYPTQVVAKSAKPIPVLILGVVIARKSYTIQRYFFVLTIVVGVVIFLLKPDKLNQSNDEQVFGWGEILLLFSLAMDGTLAAIQDRMRAASSPTARQMMVATNGWSMIFLVFGIFLTGEAMEFVKFATNYPNVLYEMGLFGVTGALGQLCIFTMVSSFGPLACSIVTTTRKFFTVLFSVIFNGNTLTWVQWIGVGLVFAGLFADAFFGKKTKPKKNDCSTDVESAQNVENQQKIESTVQSPKTVST